MRTFIIIIVTLLLLIGCGYAAVHYFYNSIKSSEVSALDNIKLHFTALDLNQLDCHVYEQPRFLKLELPLIGAQEMYLLRSENRCASTLISSVSDAAPLDSGTWQGIAASTKGFARKSNYTLREYKGHLGDYSEIVEFRHNGNYAGFEYRVLTSAHIQVVRIESDSIYPDDAFEHLLATKLPVTISL